MDLVQHPLTYQYIMYMHHVHDKCHFLIAVLKIHSVLHWSICNVLPQFNVSGINSSLLCNNVLIHWCWLLLLLLAGYCQRVELVTFGFLPHSTVVHHSTNQCSNYE